MKPHLLSEPAAGFLNITTRSDLADWLGMSDAKLRFILYGMRDSERYASFSIPKRNGGSREIRAPTEVLKKLQRQLLTAFEEIVQPGVIAKGFVSGKSIFDHAKDHRRRRWIVVADLKNFFPTINFGRVRGAFRSSPFKFNDNLATVLAQLCCDHGYLPQGAPTSPVISNLLCRSLDRELLRFAIQARCRVTRYADDVCFSTNANELSAELVVDKGEGLLPSPELVQLARKAGFELNLDKFKVFHARDRQLVTGLIVNKKISMPRYWRRQLRTIIHVRQKYGAENGVAVVNSWLNRGPRKKISSLDSLVAGKAGFLAWLDGLSGTRHTDALVRQNPTARSLPRLKWLRPVTLMAEGHTDLMHLKAALAWAQGRSVYLDFNIKFNNFPDENGDTQLWNRIQWIAKQDFPEIEIAVFDCDNLGLMKKMDIQPGSFRRIGSSTYVMCLAPVGNLAEERFCIENLYVRAEISKPTSAGRRLFFFDEFDSAGRHSSEPLYRSQPASTKKIVLEDVVYRDGDPEHSLTLSKSKFAEMIVDKEAPFSAINFSGFLPTFECIRNLVEQHLRKMQ